VTSAVLAAAAFVLAYVLRRPLRRFPAHALALGIVLSLVAAPHIYAQDLTVLALACVVVASRRGNTALLIMLALSAIAAVGFLEAPEILRLLPETALLMAALILDDLREVIDRRERETLPLQTPLPVHPVPAPLPLG
jgi:hypothetical protein